MYATRTGTGSATQPTIPSSNGKTAAGNTAAVQTSVDNDAILGQLLLDKDDFLRAFDNKVAARVQRALAHARQLLLALPSQHTPFAA